MSIAAQRVHKHTAFGLLSISWSFDTVAKKRYGSHACKLTRVTAAFRDRPYASLEDRRYALKEI